MDEIKDKIILAVKKAITNRAEVVDCYHDIMEIDCNDVDYIAEQVVDALLAANIGDVTEWKERAEKAEQEVSALNERAKRFKIVVPMGTTVNSFGSELYRTQPNPYGVKQLYSDEEVEDIARQRNEYKYRAEVAERAFDNTIKAFHETLSALFPDTKVDLDKWKKDNLANAEKELAEEG